MDTDTVVDEYLGRLQAAAGRLTLDRRAELVDEVREHITAALAAEGRRDEATLRNMLDRLGQPEDIVAAEGEPDGPMPGLGRGRAATRRCRRPRPVGSG